MTNTPSIGRSRLALTAGLSFACIGTSLATAPSPFTGHYGPLLTNGGVSFRVWAPHAASVALAGTFNGWSTSADLLARDVVETNYWSIFRSNVAAGAQYKFVVNGTLWKLDPWSRELAYSGGNANSVLRNPARVAALHPPA